MGTTAWPDSPASLDEAKNVYLDGGGLRAFGGARSLSELMEYRPVTASAVLRTQDICAFTSSAVLRTAGYTPSASGGVTLSGNGGAIPRYVYGGENQTAPSSVTVDNTVPVYDISNVMLAGRIYSATRALAVATGLTFGGPAALPTTSFYEYGNWAVGTNSDNYQLVLDLDNQDATNGSFMPVEMFGGFGRSSIYGVVWMYATGVA